MRVFVIVLFVLYYILLLLFTFYDKHRAYTFYYVGLCQQLLPVYLLT